MLILLSPSKTLDFESTTALMAGDDPELLTKAARLVSRLRKLKPSEISVLMNLSPKLADMGARWFGEWHYPADSEKSRPAIAGFKGDVYEGLKAWELNAGELRFADAHVRILSGLYGILKPTDSMLPYRLEMATPLKGKEYNSLYQYWGEPVTKIVKRDLKKTGDKVIVNLASDEYARVVDLKAIGARVVTPVFKEFRNGTFRFISYNGKRARGLMTRYIISNAVTDPELLKLFDYEGYEYLEQHSGKDEWLFAR